MLELSRKIASFFLRTSNDSAESSTLKERYKQFRISLLFAITIIALLPSTLLAVLGYFQYLDLAQRQGAKHIQWHLQYVRNAMENRFKTLVENLTLNTLQTPFDLLKEEQRDKFLHHLKPTIKGLRTIDILERKNNTFSISHPRIQRLSADPHNTWLQKLISGTPTISTVQLNQDNSFRYSIGITYTQKSLTSDFYVVFSFDTAPLQTLLEQTNAGAVEDVFIISQEGTLLTNSIYFGNIQNHFPIRTPVDSDHLTTTDKNWGMGNIFYATTPISETPWILVLIKDGPIKKKEWLTFQMTLVFIFLSLASGSYFIIHQLVNLLTIRIRESDTKRMALLNEVGHTNRLATIGKLAAGVAHEINNPLAVIDQKAGLIEDLLELAEKFTKKDKVLKSLQGIHSSVERCKIITHRLLGFARKVDMEKELLNINIIIQEVMGFLEKEALYSHIFFKMQLIENLPEIWSDRGQLQQIFLNIISNSIDAIGNNGIITITTSLISKKKILVEIEDNGPGIKPDVMEHIFDPFFTTKETGEGTGLGLSITYGLVKKLGGDIKVRSTINEGVTFYIYLPIRSSRKRGENHG